MAKIEETNNAKKPETNKKTQVTNKTQTSQKDGQDIQAFLKAMEERMNNLEKENKQLNQELTEKKEHMFQKAKERYEGPRHYSYKLWGGVPVLGYISKRLDSTKDLLYKNKYGEYTSNHILELSLADGKTEPVEVNDFNSSFTRSEKMPAKVISDGYNVTGYEFDSEEYGSFVVNPNVIN